MWFSNVSHLLIFAYFYILLLFIKGLSVISVDATSKKVHEMLKYLKSVNTKNVEDSTRYTICIQAYTMAVQNFLPAAYSQLNNKSFFAARSEMIKVVSVSDKCEAQFAGSSPLTQQRNKDIHDIADTSADIMKYFIANS